MNLFLWVHVLDWVLLVVFFLTVHTLFLLFQHSPLVVFLLDVPLHAEHQQNLLSQLVIQLGVGLSGNDLLGNVHTSKDFHQFLVDFAWKFKRRHEVLLAGEGFAGFADFNVGVTFVQVEVFFWDFVEFEDFFEVDLFSFLFFDELN